MRTPLNAPLTLILLALLLSIGGHLTSDAAEPETGPPLSKDILRPDNPFNDASSLKRLQQDLAVHPDDARRWTSLGWQLYKAGRYGEADWSLGQARRLTPDDTYLLWLSGLTSYALGDNAAAKDFLHKVYFGHKTWPDAINMAVTFELLGRLLLAEKDLFSAAIYFSKACDLAPDNWQVHYLRGFTEWYRERYYDANEALEKAHELNPRDPCVLKYYARALAAVKERDAPETGPARLEPAIAATRRAIAADPRDYYSRELLARIRASQGKPDEAIATLRESLPLDPYSVSNRTYLALLLLTVTRTPEAGAEAEQLLLQAMANQDYPMEPNHTPHMLYIAHLMNVGRYAEANALLTWSRSHGVFTPP